MTKFEFLSHFIIENNESLIFFFTPPPQKKKKKSRSNCLYMQRRQEEPNSIWQHPLMWLLLTARNLLQYKQNAYEIT